MATKNANSQRRRLHNVEITVDGKPIPEPLEIIDLGTEAVYGRPNGTERLGGFHVWRPKQFKMRFRLTDDGTIRQLCGSKEEIIQSRTMVVRWLDATGNPVCTDNFTGVLFLDITRVKPVEGDPYEQVTVSAETLSTGGQAA